MEQTTKPTREPSTIYGFWPQCSHEISQRGPCVALWLQVERQVPKPTVIPEVDALDSHGMIALCRDCGYLLEGSESRRLIHERYGLRVLS